MRARGDRVSLLVLYTLFPVPQRAILRALEGIRRIVVPELNSGQYAREVAALARDREQVTISRIDGTLIEPLEIVEAVAS
jgi:2-oxoglutarate ferredoxin oxidoreductase subunit alpha